MINRASQSRRLLGFFGNTMKLISTQCHTIVPGWVDRTVCDHPDIIDALAAGDGKLARQLTVDHYERAGRLLVADLADHGFWDLD